MGKKAAPKASDFGGPSRPKSGYMLFQDTIRAGLIEKLKAQAAASGGKFDLTQIGKQGADQWKALPEDKKQEFNAKYNYFKII